MRIVEPRRKPSGGKVFSGKVRVTIQGLAINGLLMTFVDDMPSRSMTIEMTTVEEVYELIHSVVRDVIEHYAESEAQAKFIERLKSGEKG